MRKIIYVLLGGVVMAALPTFVVVGTGDGLMTWLPRIPEYGFTALVSLVALVCFVFMWWLGRRLRFTSGDLFLSCGFCWVLLGIFFGGGFGRSGLFAVLFLIIGEACYQFPKTGRSRGMRIFWRILFWTGYVVTFVFFHPLTEGKSTID